MSSLISKNPMRTELVPPEIHPGLAGFHRRGDATVLLIVTEGANDPDNYERIVGRGHETVGRVLTAVR